MQWHFGGLQLVIVIFIQVTEKKWVVDGGGFCISVMILICLSLRLSIRNQLILFGVPAQ